jgi:hypothetical protein
MVVTVQRVPRTAPRGAHQQGALDRGLDLVQLADGTDLLTGGN